MSTEIKTMSSSETATWDTYVNAHPKATLYHLSAWKNVIKKTYKHKTYYLMAVNSSQYKVEDRPYSSRTQSSKEDISTAYQLTANSYKLDSNRVVGILPLIHLKHFIFGKSLISIPFFDIGGILANDEETEKALLSEAIKLGQELKANNIELRHIEPLTWLGNSSQLTDDSSELIAHSSKEEPGTASELSAKSYDLGCGAAPELPPINYATRSHKVRMLLKLPESSEALMKSFKSKLRSQVKKPLKEGLLSKIGGLELLDDFYKVFSINMRDLGSPLHSKKLIKHVLEEFSQKAMIVLVYKDSEPLACSIIIGFNDTLENPWASSLHNYSRMAPNMLLYWTMLEYACGNGYRYFDFGRSTPDEGTYKFKEQWGAKPTPLHWHYLSLNGTTINEETSEKSKFDKAIQYWQKLPVPVTKIIGPMIRKHIGL
jgi:serine/alanine adding enzyme